MKSMELQLNPLTGAQAEQIVGWRYPEPYAIYDLDDDPAALAELLCGEYYAALDREQQLVGFCCFGRSAQVPAGWDAGCYQAQAVDIGLGLRPDLTGQGLGANLLQAAIGHAVRLLGASTLRLTVLQFNQRAIKLYSRCGFTPICQFSAGGEERRTFLVMTRLIAAN